MKGGKEDKEGVGSQGMDLERDRGARNVSSQSRCHGGCQAGARVSLHAASIIVRASLCLQL